MINQIDPHNIDLFYLDRLRGDLAIAFMPFMVELWDRNGALMFPQKSLINMATIDRVVK